MRLKISAGCVLALSLLAPAFSAPATYEVGALRVEQVSTNGSPLILIPGLACGPWVWESTVARLKDRHAIYLVTLPGFDGRPAQAGVTIASLQRDVRALIEKRHLAKPVLIGHSLGATLALGVATEDSALIAGVVAIDGLPVFPGTESITGDRSALAQGAHAQMDGQTPDQFAAYQQTYMKRMGVIDEATALRLAANSSRSEVAATAEFAAQLLALDLRPRLTAIKVPVVEISPFLAADFAAMGVDENGKTGYYRMLLTGIERLEVVSISPARHFVMFDQPEKFAAALDRALADMLESASK